jgi:hypothetical protein
MTFKYEQKSSMKLMGDKMRKSLQWLIGIILVFICYNFVGCEKKKSTQPEEESTMEIINGVTDEYGNISFYSEFIRDTLKVKITDQLDKSLKGINTYFLAIKDTAIILACDTTARYLPGVFTVVKTVLSAPSKMQSYPARQITIVLIEAAKIYLHLDLYPPSIAAKSSIMRAVASSFPQMISTFTVQSTLQNVWHMIPYETGEIIINSGGTTIFGEIAINKSLSQDMRSQVAQKIVDEFNKNGVQLDVRRNYQMEINKYPIFFPCSEITIKWSGFSEDFESYQQDSYPSHPWQSLFDGKTASISEEEAFEGIKSFKLEGYSNWPRYEYIEVFNLLDSVKYEACMYMNSQDKGGAVGFLFKHPVYPTRHRWLNPVLACLVDSVECQLGDVNMNTVSYEVADAVLFANYFVYGTSVFIHDIDYQICATDVNEDGITLTLSDLVYLVRIISHDAIENPTPSSDTVNVFVHNNVISTDCVSPIGAILFEFDGAVQPTLMIDMEMIHNSNRVLVWSRNGNCIEHHSWVLRFIGDAELASVDAVDCDSRELKTSVSIETSTDQGPLSNAVQFSQDGKVKFKTTTNADTVLDSWAPGIWYKIRVEIDFKNQVADVYINDILRGNNLAADPKIIPSYIYGETITLNKFGLATNIFDGSGSSVIYFDNVKLYPLQIF